MVYEIAGSSNRQGTGEDTASVALKTNNLTPGRSEEVCSSGESTSWLLAHGKAPPKHKDRLETIITREDSRVPACPTCLMAGPLILLLQDTSCMSHMLQIR